MKTKLQRIADALGEMPLVNEHETGEMIALSLRDYLRTAIDEDATGGLTVEDVLTEMARIAVREYERDA